jgi:hypothetical protein
MNTNVIRASDRIINAPVSTPETKRARYASDKSVKKATKRAIKKFAAMFRKLAE